MFKKRVAILVVLTCGCGTVEPEPAWVVRGIVLAGGQPLEGASVVLKSLPSLLGPGPSGAGSSASDGHFELSVRAPACGFMFFEVTRRGYVQGSVSGFTTARCPAPLDGVRILMDPNPPLLIQSVSLPPGVPTLPYEEYLSADGGDFTYSWSIASGSLPDGLTLDPAGRIAGSPTAAGTSLFTVEVADGAGASATADLSITVLDAVVLRPSESCAAAPDSAVVTFTDPDLGRVARTAAGLEDDELLTCAVAAGITGLDASGATLRGHRGSIASLAGLQNLSGLARLDLTWNEIASLDPLRGLTGLTQLAVGSNRVRDLTSLAGLDTLVLAGNTITSLEPRSGLMALNRLELQSNHVSDITPLGGLVALETLDLARNAIATLPTVAGLGALTTLRLSDNALTSTAGLEGLTGLVDLDLHSNPLTDLSGLATLTALERLDLSASYRSLGNLTPLVALTALEELDLSVGIVSDIGPLAGLTTLRTLDLSDNAIVDVSPLSGLTNLTVLKLRENHVSDVGPLAGLTAVVTLDLQANRISDIGPLAGLDGVVDLDLARNTITDVSSLQGLTTLNLLWLWANASLADIEPLIANTGLGFGDVVSLTDTAVPCDAVHRLQAKRVTVASSACG